MSYSGGGGAMGNGLPGTIPDQGPNAPLGTEYTLQGVMRFLQMEWHSHERARNSWDIERAEMKAKIAKQEGEIRHSKKMHDQLNRQIRMLEIALKKERTKPQSNGLINGDTDRKKESEDHVSDKPEDAPAAHRPDNVPHQSFMALTDYETSTEELEKCRDKSKRYLDKCLQEVQYLLAPPPHPVPAKWQMQNGSYTGLTDPPPPPVEEVYIRHGAQKGLQPVRQMMPNVQPSVLNHISDKPSVARTVEDIYMSREMPFTERLNHRSDGQNGGKANVQPSSDTTDEPVEVITHSYDSYGRPVSNVAPPTTSLPEPAQDADGWDFEEQQAISLAEQPVEVPRRPDTDLFPSASDPPAKLLSPRGPGRRRSSGSGGLRRKSSGSTETHDSGVEMAAKVDQDKNMFKVRFALRGHLDVVRSVISTGGGSPSEPEICTAGDDGTIKRWIIPASYGNLTNTLNDLDIACYFTHRGHDGIITSLAACQSTNFSTGGRAAGDGWIFSGGQDATVRVWERGRVDPKATLEGHTDAVWTVCVLPGTSGSIFGNDCNNVGGTDRIVLASGSADGTVRVWTVSQPPQLSAPQASSSRRGVGGSRRHSVTSGSNHPSSPQPNVATSTALHYTLVHTIARPRDSNASPTNICPLNTDGENFVVSYTDATVLVFDTRTGEELIGMASNETYNGTMDTSVNTVVARAMDSSSWGENQDESMGAGPTGTAQGAEGVIVSGHEDRYIRFFDANSGQCTYGMLAHPAAISSLSLSPDGHEAVSAGHDASIRFWSLDKRICTQEITCHRPMRGEGVCSVVWSTDGRYVVSGGGDGVVKVFAR